ncbi:TPA: hypothetical protein ACH3X1_005014 [Trebouxia sp. C0004]
MQSLKPQDAYEYISDVELQHDQVRHISGGCSCKSDLVLSVSAHESGWPHVIVGSDRAGSLVCKHVNCCSMPGLKRKCRHCKTVCTWLKTIDHDLDMLETSGEDPARLDRLSALAAEMEGYQLLKDNQSLSQGAAMDICPIRVTKIAFSIGLQAFIVALAIEYESLFTCPICKEHGYTIIIDGKAMGVNRKLSKAHQCCMADGAATVSVECSHAQVVALPEPEARRLLEELATGRLPIGSYHELHALCDKVNSQLGLLLASGYVVVAPLWFGAQLTFNLSLSMTNVTSNTILSSTSSLFTFALSCLLLGEKYTFVKLGSIVVCIAGVVMVTFGDSSHSEGRQSFVGDMLCLLSSLLYASYTIAIRQMLPNDENADVTTFFGFIGLLNLVFMAPVLIILWLTSVVQLQGMTAWLLLLAVCKGLFDNVLSDYLWARAVLLLGPTLATVGLSVQVPLAVAAEGIFGTPEWLHSHGSAAFMILGAIAVLMGFMGVSLSHTSAILQRYSHTSAIQQDASDNQADSEECEASMYRNDSVLPPDGSGGF